MASPGTCELLMTSSLCMGWLVFLQSLLWLFQMGEARVSRLLSVYWSMAVWVWLCLEKGGSEDDFQQCLAYWAQKAQITCVPFTGKKIWSFPTTCQANRAESQAGWLLAQRGYQEKTTDNLYLLVPVSWDSFSSSFLTETEQTFLMPVHK